MPTARMMPREAGLSFTRIDPRWDLACASGISHSQTCDRKRPNKLTPALVMLAVGTPPPDTNSVACPARGKAHIPERADGLHLFYMKVHHQGPHGIAIPNSAHSAWLVSGINATVRRALTLVLPRSDSASSWQRPTWLHPQCVSHA